MHVYITKQLFTCYRCENINIFFSRSNSYPSLKMSHRNLDIFSLKNPTILLVELNCSNFGCKIRNTGEGNKEMFIGVSRNMENHASTQQLVFTNQLWMHLLLARRTGGCSIVQQIAMQNPSQDHKQCYRSPCEMPNRKPLELTFPQPLTQTITIVYIFFSLKSSTWEIPSHREISNQHMIQKPYNPMYTLSSNKKETTSLSFVK